MIKHWKTVLYLADAIGRYMTLLPTVNILKKEMSNTSVNLLEAMSNRVKNDEWHVVNVIHLC